MATLNIPQNTYVKPQPRMKVAQMICDALLAGYKICVEDGPYRPGTWYVSYYKGEACLTTGSCDDLKGQEYYEFTDEEAQLAFNGLRAAGYHMMVEYEHGSYKKYFCSRRGDEYRCSEATKFAR